MEATGASANSPITRAFLCPHCKGRIQWCEPQTVAPSGKPWNGQLSCLTCRRSWPLENGVLRFITDDSYTASFGWQWRYFKVVRPEEDRTVFRVKTGVDPEDLRGLRVLDAGCGSGRYSRLVAAAGAMVLGIDRSRAVDAAAQLCRNLPTAHFAQADLLNLPLESNHFDFVFSIGVLHHCPDPRRAFAELARVVRPGGRLAVWVYRRNTWLQEKLNQTARSITLRLDQHTLHQFCRALALLGAVPVVRSTLNKLLNFSNHPDPELRVCDNYDWYACQYQSHHTEEEVASWFQEEGFSEVRFLPPQRSGKVYEWAYRKNLIIGSGVNAVGTKKRAS